MQQWQRHFGVFSRVKQSLTRTTGNRQETATADEQKWFFKFLSESPQFTFNEFETMYKRMSDKAGGSGWRSFLPNNGNSQPEMQEVKLFLRVLGAMDPAVRNDYKKLTGPERARVAAKAGLTIADVRLVWKTYMYFLINYRMLRGAVNRGRKTPSSMEEMAALMRDPANRPSEDDIPAEFLKLQSKIMAQGMERKARGRTPSRRLS